MFHVGRLTRMLTLLSGLVLVGGLVGAQGASAAGGSGVSASYNGGTINLSQGWGTASVCAVTSSSTSCFSSRSDFQTWVSTQSLLGTISMSPLTNCSTGLKLYSATNYGGTELVLYTQATWINLSAYSFASVTSSYKVGACAVGMAAGMNGTGAAYPGATAAGSSATTMGTWNDRVQSVYIS